MKKLILICAFTCIGFLTGSCSTDNNGTPVPEVSVYDLNVLQEETTIPLGEINMVISGAIVKSAPIVSNGAIEMTVPSEESLAFPKEGFDIKLSTQSEFKGVYLQLKGASEYYDIPKERLMSARPKGLKMKSKTAFNTGALTKVKAGNYVLPVDFGTTIEPGTFCYEIYIYDSEGNVSVPMEVCVTVKFFGGLEDMAGEWNLQSMTNNGSEKIVPGEELCETYQEECNGDYYDLKECSDLPNIRITANIEGTYILEFSGEGKISYESLNSDCEITNTIEEDGITTETGYWSYDVNDENQKRLIMIAYSVVYKTADGTEETYTFEEGEASLNNNVLNISEDNFDITFMEEDQGNSRTETYYFSR